MSSCFRDKTVIKFKVLDEIYQWATLIIYDIHGKVIFETKIKLNGFGEYNFVWDGKTNDGKSINQGIYTYRISYNNIAIGGHIIKVE